MQRQVRNMARAARAALAAAAIRPGTQEQLWDNPPHLVSEVWITEINPTDTRGDRVNAIHKLMPVRT